MRNLIKADLSRIMRKKSVWFVIILMMIVVTFSAIYGVVGAPDRDFSFAVSTADGISYIGLIIGLVLVFGVYSDDFKSTTYINTIGRGLTREKFIIAKFIDVLLIFFGVYLLGGLLILGLMLMLGVNLSSMEAMFLVLRCFTDIINATVGVMIASAFFYLSENATLGIIVYLGIELLIPVALEFLHNVQFVAKYHLDRLYISGACSEFSSDFLTGQTARGILVLILTLVVYIGGAILASILIFKKKELDF